MPLSCKTKLKKGLHFRDGLERTLKEKLFQPSQLLSNTVQQVLDETLTIRDTILDRLKKLRKTTGDDKIEICPGQGVNQEAFLSMVRMDIMGVLLSLIEQGADTEDNLKVQLQNRPKKRKIFHKRHTEILSL